MARKTRTASVMHQIKESDLRAEIGRMTKAADIYQDNACAVWDAFSHAHTADAELIIPLGEMLNSHITGYIWAWRKEIQPCDVGRISGLAVQGLEGCFKVQTSLITALLVAQKIEPGRVAIFTTWHPDQA